MLEAIEGKLKDVVYADATDFIMKNDREHFDSVFAVIESFTINNDGIIGGNNGINILAGVPKSKDSYMYEIYIADVDKNARALADLLYNSEHKYVDKNTIRLETKLRNRIYELWIEARQIARIYSLVDYRGIKLFMLLNPVRAYGYFVDSSSKNQKVFCMSSEIQLLDIYRRLYNPYPSARGGINYETYDVLLSNEKKLYDVIAEDIINRAKGTKQDIMSVTRAEGGEEIGEKIREIREEEIEKIEEISEIREEEISGGNEYKAVPIIAKQLIKELSDLNKDTVIVGDYALYQILPNYPKEERLQILTTESMENIKNIATGILSSNKDLKNYSGVKVIGIRYPLNLPNDIMIEKFSLYLQNGDAQTFICDVFNSPSYEMIPFIRYESRIKYANLIVCLRFKFIDLYVSRLIHNLREGKDEFIVKKINQIAGSISMIRNKVTEMIESDPEKVFSTNSENYAGIFIMPNVILRTKIAEILKGKKYHYNYYPAAKQQ